MNTPASHRQYATSLLSDMDGVSAANLPRREVLADWLREFLERSARRGFSLEVGDITDLTAVHDYLVKNQVVSTPRPVLM